MNAAKCGSGIWPGWCNKISVSVSVSLSNKNSVSVSVRLYYGLGYSVSVSVSVDEITIFRAILARVPRDASKGLMARESDISPRLEQVADRSNGEGSQS